MRKSPKIDFFRDPLTRTVQPQDSFAVLPAPNVPLEILLCMIIVYLREAQLGFRPLQIRLPKTVGCVLQDVTNIYPSIVHAAMALNGTPDFFGILRC
jgi:hypothetical protein